MIDPSKLDPRKTQAEIVEGQGLNPPPIYGGCTSIGCGSGPDGEYTDADVAVMNYDRALTEERRRNFKRDWKDKRVIAVGRLGVVIVGDVIGFTDPPRESANVYAKVRNVLTDEVWDTPCVLYAFSVQRLEHILAIPREYRLDLLSTQARDMHPVPVATDKPELSFQQLMDNLYINFQLDGFDAAAWLKLRTAALQKK